MGAEETLAFAEILVSNSLLAPFSTLDITPILNSNLDCQSFPAHALS